MASLNGQNYLFGGYDDNETQVSVVQGCSLNRIDSLPFNFRWGTCRSYMFGCTPKILLCFDPRERERCRT